MRFYKVEDQIVISDKELTVGTELIPNTTDAAGEKHVPVIIQSGDLVTVKVGSVEHPSLDAHYIEWIVLVTEGGFQMHYLKPGMKPEAVFKTDEKVIVAYRGSVVRNESLVPEKQFLPIGKVLPDAHIGMSSQCGGQIEQPLLKRIEADKLVEKTFFLYVGTVTDDHFCVVAVTVDHTT